MTPKKKPLAAPTLPAQQEGPSWYCSQCGIANVPRRMLCKTCCNCRRDGRFDIDGYLISFADAVKAGEFDTVDHVCTDLQIAGLDDLESVQGVRKVLEVRSITESQYLFIYETLVDAPLNKFTDNQCARIAKYRKLLQVSLSLPPPSAPVQGGGDRPPPMPHLLLAGREEENVWRTESAERGLSPQEADIGRWADRRTPPFERGPPQAQPAHGGREGAGRWGPDGLREPLERGLPPRREGPPHWGEPDFEPRQNRDGPWEEDRRPVRVEKRSREWQQVDFRDPYSRGEPPTRNGPGPRTTYLPPIVGDPRPPLDAPFPPVQSRAKVISRPGSEWQTISLPPVLPRGGAF